MSGSLDEGLICRLCCFACSCLLLPWAGRKSMLATLRKPLFVPFIALPVSSTTRRFFIVYSLSFESILHFSHSSVMLQDHTRTPTRTVILSYIYEPLLPPCPASPLRSSIKTLISLNISPASLFPVSLHSSAHSLPKRSGCQRNRS